VPFSYFPPPPPLNFFSPLRNLHSPLLCAPVRTFAYNCTHAVGTMSPGILNVAKSVLNKGNGVLMASLTQLVGNGTSYLHTTEHSWQHLHHTNAGSRVLQGTFGGDLSLAVSLAIPKFNTQTAEFLRTSSTLRKSCSSYRRQFTLPKTHINLYSYRRT
jgi:hypothetical protein